MFPRKEEFGWGRVVGALRSSAPPLPPQHQLTLVFVMSAREGHHVVFLAPSLSFLPQSKFVLLFDLNTYRGFGPGSQGSEKINLTQQWTVVARGVCGRGMGSGGGSWEGGNVGKGRGPGQHSILVFFSCIFSFPPPNICLVSFFLQN